jgi:hypothetical protein
MDANLRLQTVRLDVLIGALSRQVAVQTIEVSAATPSRTLKAGAERESQSLPFVQPWFNHVFPLSGRHSQPRFRQLAAILILGRSRTLSLVSGVGMSD